VPAGEDPAGEAYEEQTGAEGQQGPAKSTGSEALPQNLTPVSLTRRPDQPHAERMSFFEGISARDGWSGWANGA
jgi:hypothetical protein